MKTKILALFAVLVLAVAAAGTAYAAWTATITFTGSISTGNVAVEVTNVDTTSPEISPTIGVNKDSFDVTVSNIYPGWSGSVTITVTNTGSLPVTIGTPSVNVVSDANNLDYYLHIATDPAAVPTDAIPSGGTASVEVTLSVDNDAGVPQSATATYSGSITFTGP
jgi:hypothetical protein